jgi:hypothetical protein
MTDMGDRTLPIRAPGGTILGGAAGGFSYEGARNDAWAREDASLKQPAEPAHKTAKPAARTPSAQAKRLD